MWSMQEEPDLKPASAGSIVEEISYFIRSSVTLEMILEIAARHIFLANYRKSLDYTFLEFSQ